MKTTFSYIVVGLLTFILLSTFIVLYLPSGGKSIPWLSEVNAAVVEQKVEYRKNKITCERYTDIENNTIFIDPQENEIAYIQELYPDAICVDTALAPYVNTRTIYINAFQPVRLPPTDLWLTPDGKNAIVTKDNVIICTLPNTRVQINSTAGKQITFSVR